MMEFDLALVGAVLILIIGIRTTWQRQFNLKEECNSRVGHTRGDII